MFRRPEAVPFTFLAEADRFRGNVEPPPRVRTPRGQLAGRALVGLVAVAGFVGSLLFGLPALQANPTLHGVDRPEAAQGR